MSATSGSSRREAEPGAQRRLGGGAAGQDLEAHEIDHEALGVAVLAAEHAAHDDRALDGAVAAR